MRENCGKSCNPCMICQDDNENCPAWASLGHCEDDLYADYMGHCKKSCRQCSPFTAFSALKDKPIKDGELVITQESIRQQMNRILDLCDDRNGTCGVWKSGTQGYDEISAFESERCPLAALLLGGGPPPGAQDNWLTELCKVSCDICSSECGYVAKSTRTNRAVKRYRYQCEFIHNVCEGRIHVPGRSLENINNPHMSDKWPGVAGLSCLRGKPRAFMDYASWMRPRFLSKEETEKTDKGFLGY